MMKQLLSLLITGILGIFLFTACATAPYSPREGWARNYKITEHTPSVQEKENIRITLTPINELELNKYPELFQFDISNWGREWKIAKAIKSVNYWYPPDLSGNQYGNTFVGMPTFMVKIENNTGHILRMSDSRIYLIVEGLDPIPALNTFGNPDWVLRKLNIYGERDILITRSAAEGDGSLLSHIANYEYDLVKQLMKITDPDNAKSILFSNSKNYSLRYPRYPFNLLSQTAIDNVRNYKLINEVGREILPGFIMSGIICFPGQFKKKQTAKVMFYDVTIETDNAGNPIKKTQFEFAIQYVPQYVRYNELTGNWDEVAEFEAAKVVDENKTQESQMDFVPQFTSATPGEIAKFREDITTTLRQFKGLAHRFHFWAKKRELTTNYNEWVKSLYEPQFLDYKNSGHTIIVWLSKVFNDEISLK